MLIISCNSASGKQRAEGPSAAAASREHAIGSAGEPNAAGSSSPGKAPHRVSSKLKDSAPAQVQVLKLCPVMLSGFLGCYVWRRLAGAR